MAIQSNIILQKEQTTIQPAIIVDVIDIENITIKTNEHKVIFSYNLIQYERNENGDIIINDDGKKLAKIIETRTKTVGDEYYTTVFEETVGDKKRGEDIENILINWIKQFDKDFSDIDALTKVNLEDLNII